MPVASVGPYRLLQEVDGGVVSIVFRAEHQLLGTVHALKWLRRDQEEPMAEALVRAARLQARVIHPHVVRATDAGFCEGRPFMVTDWIEGRTLADRLDDKGALPVQRALYVFRAILRGVQALHETNVVHRDLKPSNVLVEVRDQRITPKVTDLGLAKEVVPGEKPKPAGLSREYRTLGTPEYMAPEQASDVGSVDARADVWSLGVILYELLTNEVPFEADTPWATMVRARLGQYLPLRDRAPHVPEVLEDLVRDMLRVDLAARIPSCLDVLARLDGV